MSSAKITLLGQYNYDNTLFDGLTFPAGINKQTAVDEILLKAADFEVLYPDISFNKQAITHWGVKNFRTFEQWVKALAIEFDPLYNYDRFEEYTDEKLSQGNTKNTAINESNTNEVNSSTENSTSSNNDSGQSVTQTNTDSTSSDTDTRNVSAYDAATYQPREQEIKSNTSGQTGNGMAVNSNKSESEAESSANNIRSSGTTENSSNDTTSNNTEQIKHTAHLYGNIGVTTSTQMLEDFLRVERFNIYEQLADMFISELCLLIY